MAPPSSYASQIPQLSPAELSYLHTSLSYPNNPIRPDGRSATQFRPLTAETNILPGANGSARIGFADGTQAIVGVKAEVEKTVLLTTLNQDDIDDEEGGEGADAAGASAGERGGRSGGRGGARRSGQSSWVEMSIEIPGLRDDDALPVFLAEMMREALVGSGAETAGELEAGAMSEGLRGRLVINQGWHWRIYIDILLLSPPLTYPLPLLSLTTHLALLSTKLPRLISKDEEDPMFDDDWEAAEYLYPRPRKSSSSSSSAPSLKQQQQQQQPQLFRPPITLLVVTVGENIIFDPTQEEISVAEAVHAVSVARSGTTSSTLSLSKPNQQHQPSNLKLLAIRTIDPPSRLTNPGVPNSENAATIGGGSATEAGTESSSTVTAETSTFFSGEEVPGVWRPRRGGVKRAVISKIVETVLRKGGVGDEVMEGLEGVEAG
ncbi:hypothetical protein AJ80_07829 [Polytolypa hystricis UAMH7299]|uniref:Ribosomal RNA-processing protein 42 n=1 Tax=Polytolypa hystricis (strain UAMH7299) TaxID=1447883 RepID=A0A2B7XHX0_POLH7|nr:hypothetical protein AJ80_07829 [Polytolypa hystricis UAMH7299]